MDDHFAFLKRARPDSIHKLLERLSVSDAAVVLAGLPAAASVQIMAYFPESRQGELMPALREARREGPERAAAVASRIREMLAAAKSGAALPPRPAPPPGNAGGSPSPRIPPPVRPVPPSPAKPAPWIPRAATTSPINGPALPGKPPPVEGDPLRSPLARAGLLDLIGRAREKLLPGGKAPPVPPRAAGGAAAAPPKPGAEGVAPSGKIRVGREPRVIGPAAREKEADGGARRMDGKAVLAAILREAGGEVRGNVRREDPSLFRELHDRMFHFDDLMRADDGALARIFTVAPAGEAALALRFAAPALRDRALRAVSPGRALVLRDAGPGRAGVDAIEAAQKKILDVALRLQSAGRILIDPRDPDLAEG